LIRSPPSIEIAAVAIRTSFGPIFVRREFDSNEEPVRGLRSIDTNEVATIVWIFERYARMA